MRIWSLHPALLDRQALIACWRETLLAQKVLQGRTRGYRHHPQLERFQQLSDPVAAVGEYLTALAEEATARGYHFNDSKIVRRAPGLRIPVTEGQLECEWQHLLAKMQQRSPELYQERRDWQPTAHPLFDVIPGPREPWEKS